MKETCFDQSGEVITNDTFKDFKTDYLIGMTRIQKRVECVADSLKEKYDLSNDQYIKLVDFICGEEFNNTLA